MEDQEHKKFMSQILVYAVWWYIWTEADPVQFSASR